jgi:hypothetical protein
MWRNPLGSEGQKCVRDIQICSFQVCLIFRISGRNSVIRGEVCNTPYFYAILIWGFIKFRENNLFNKNPEINYVIIINVT